MSAFHPRTKKTGEITNLSFIERKTESLDTEFKNVAYRNTDIFIGIDLKRGETIQLQQIGKY